MAARGSGAPRRPARPWPRLARGAGLALAIVAAGPAAAQVVTAASYADPVGYYGHGVLGAEGEYATLSVTLSDGRRIAARWDGPPMLFEDTAPRLADLDGDGAPEVVVVESHVGKGARLAVWGVRNGGLVPLARGPFIGTRYRWLAPFAAGDLDGDGLAEIAYVDRPHLAKVLRVWRYVPGDAARLEPVAELHGVTNHRIGRDHVVGGVRDCGDGPELVLADAAWERIVAVRLRRGALVARDIAPRPDRARLDAALACGG